MIELINVSKKIKNEIILDNINLTIEGGFIHGFQGENGSGKTMLFRAICGLIKIDSGSIKVNNKMIDGNILPDNVGLLLENPGFINGLTGFDNLKMIASIRDVVGDDRILKVLEIVGLSGANKKIYEKYSLGMKQRLGIANVILENPDILIFDEPTNAIDMEGIIVLKEIIKTAKNEGKIVLISSHEKEIIDELSDKIYFMKEGKLSILK